jgi:spermidine synthase
VHAPLIVERVPTPRGELVLRRVGPHFEIISNGTFLMDTRDGRSERLLVRAALAELPALPALPAPLAPIRLLIAGLGVGFSLAEALADDRVRQVVVVEREQAVIRWNRSHLAELSGGALADPRVEVALADLSEYLAGGVAGRPFDVVCLDVDNGPEWTVTPENAALYGDSGLTALGRLLRPGGRLAVWSAAAAPEFERRLARNFADVRALPVDVPRGAPDVVYLARRVAY